MPKERIQKVLAEMGVASRRAVEEMVIEGRIEVDGSLVGELPCFVDPATQEIRVDGRRIKAKKADKKVYYVLNKPRGVVCTQSDPQGRPRAVDLIPDIPQRVYCVGRLDKESTGVLLLTNDGDLTHRLTHPRYGVPKTYEVQVDGKIAPEDLAKVRKGMYLGGDKPVKTCGADVEILKSSRKASWLRMTLREGRNREIRRMLSRLGYKVRRLKRVAIGPITDRGIKAGHFRPLRGGEIKALWAVADDAS
jgi:23S rRNA pseudouridine2605 synthase